MPRSARKFATLPDFTIIQGCGMGSGAMIDKKGHPHSKQKSADVSPPGYSFHFTGSAGAIEKLEEEPSAQEQDGRQIEDRPQEKRRDYRMHPRMWKKTEIRTHDGSNGTTGSNRRHGRTNIRENMEERSGSPTEEIKKEELEMAKPILHVIAENPKHPHISKEVSPAAMEKHGTEERNRLFQKAEMRSDKGIRVTGRDQAPSQYKVIKPITQPDFVKERENVQDDDGKRHSRKGPRRNIVAQRQHDKL
jgi:hypothetical protein